ncbi:MAG: DUF2268 domain-containing protein [Bacteroidales bacterium]|jgi:flagellar basal body-associated protein FliL|nr:DUF2268 domain-containing protein [Bacteroidales bacterium]
MKKKTIIILSAILLLVGGIIAIFFLNKKETGRKYEVKHKQLTPIKETLQIKINRYEQDIFAIDTANLAQGMERLHATYPDILIEEGSWENPLYIEQLKGYLSDQIIKKLMRDVNARFPNLNFLQLELENAFSYYQFYYPETTVPAMYTIVPGMDLASPSVFLYNDDLFINLDQYLGADYRAYDQYGIPRFVSERFDKKYMAIDAFKKAIVYRHLPRKKSENLLDHIIFEGKKLYFTETMFPYKPKEEIIGYSPEKYKWAERYHGEVWYYIVGKDLLFSNNDREIANYIEESPFTKPFTNESPGHMGTFIGWNIINGFMENNKGVSLDSLMQITDSRAILNGSKYKPMR